MLYDFKPLPATVYFFRVYPVAKFHENYKKYVSNLVYFFHTLCTCHLVAIVPPYHTRNPVAIRAPAHTHGASWQVDFFECTATAIPFMYSFSGNCAASVPISTFMCLWAIYIPRSVQIFPPAEKADPSWEYRHMNVEIGTETSIFLFWEYLFQIFGILSLQCGHRLRSRPSALSKMVCNYSEIPLVLWTIF